MPSGSLQSTRGGLDSRYVANHYGSASVQITQGGSAMNLLLRFGLCMVTLFTSQTTGAQEVIWEKTMKLELVFGASVEALFAHPNGDLFVGTNYGLGCGDYCGSEGLVYRSRDQGRTWEPTNYRGEGVTAFAALPKGGLLAGTLEGVFRSDDGGQTWIKLPTPTEDEWVHAVHASADSVFYLGRGGVAGAIDGGILRSTDHGQSWLEQDLGMAERWETQVHAFLALDDESLLAATSQGVFVYDQQGNWTHAGLDTANVLSLEGLRTGPIYAQATVRGSTFHDYVFRSFDRGQSWERTAWPQVGVSDLAINSQGDLLLSADSGLYGSGTGGVSWQRLGDGVQLIATTTDDHLVAFDNGSLYRSTLAVVLQDEVIPSVHTGQPVLEQNFPNPFSGETSVTFTLSQLASVELVLFNVSGREVTVLYKGLTSAGRHTVRVDAAELAAGVYFYRLCTESSSIMRQMMLAK